MLRSVIKISFKFQKWVVINTALIDSTEYSFGVLHWITRPSIDWRLCYDSTSSVGSAHKFLSTRVGQHVMYALSRIIQNHRGVLESFWADEPIRVDKTGKQRPTSRQEREGSHTVVRIATNQPPPQNGVVLEQVNDAASLSLSPTASR